jgi:glucose-1-phosphate thymidylyltransferase
MADQQVDVSAAIQRRAQGGAMKGIVLAGGAGSRLHPLTEVASKQLQPVYDKPMVYYPIATLMLAGITDILLISTPDDVPRFESLLGDGAQWGISIQYAVQDSPAGIAEALLIGESFVGASPVCLILGDNIFYGRMGLDTVVTDFWGGAVIWGYPVQDPERYGIVELDATGQVLSLEEKPQNPRTNLAIPGLYVYDNTAADRVRHMQPSPRGELEITDLNASYLADGSLRAIRLGRGIAWLDSGTHESLLDSANFIATIEKRQGLKIACLEEIALLKGYVTATSLETFLSTMPKSPYRAYCESILSSTATTS